MADATAFVQPSMLTQLITLSEYGAIGAPNVEPDAAPDRGGNHSFQAITPASGLVDGPFSGTMTA